MWTSWWSWHPTSLPATWMGLRVIFPYVTVSFACSKNSRKTLSELKPQCSSCQPRIFFLSSQACQQNIPSSFKQRLCKRRLHHGKDRTGLLALESMLGLGISWWQLITTSSLSVASICQVLTLQDPFSTFRKPSCRWFQTGSGRAPEGLTVARWDSDSVWIFKSIYTFPAADQSTPAQNSTTQKLWVSKHSALPRSTVTSRCLCPGRLRSRSSCWQSGNAGHREHTDTADVKLDDEHDRSNGTAINK